MVERYGRQTQTARDLLARENASRVSTREKRGKGGERRPPARRSPGAVNIKGCVMELARLPLSLVVDRVRGGVMRPVFDPLLPIQDHVVDPAAGVDSGPLCEARYTLRSVAPSYIPLKPGSLNVIIGIISTRCRQLAVSNIRYVRNACLRGPLPPLRRANLIVSVINLLDCIFLSFKPQQ